MIGLSGRTFSSGHVLIDCILGDAVSIARGDREAVAADNHDGVKRRATTRKLRRLLRRVITSRDQTLDVGGAQAPPAAIYERGIRGMAMRCF